MLIAVVAAMSTVNMLPPRPMPLIRDLQKKCIFFIQFKIFCARLSDEGREQPNFSRSKICVNVDLI